MIIYVWFLSNYIQSMKEDKDLKQVRSNGVILQRVMRHLKNLNVFDYLIYIDLIIELLFICNFECSITQKYAIIFNNNNNNNKADSL